MVCSVLRYQRVPECVGSKNPAEMISSIVAGVAVQRVCFGVLVVARVFQIESKIA